MSLNGHYRILEDSWTKCRYAIEARLEKPIIDLKEIEIVRY